MTSIQTYIVCWCFRQLFNLMVVEAPVDLKALFDRYSENRVIDIDHLHRFLIEFQKEDNTTVNNA
ncbi:hypothetical protein ACSBR1_026113 [Camellia fascicularis]